MSGSGRARVTVKLATTLDGRIATRTGQSQWITGPEARAVVHQLRAEHGVVLVGSQTVLDDDPRLSVRLDGWHGTQPIRAVADGRLRTPATARLVREGGGPVVILTAGLDDSPHAARIIAHGPHVTVAPVAVGPSGALDPADMLAKLAVVQARTSSADGEQRPQGVLLEGGGTLAAAFFAAGLVDRIEWFRAPFVIGAEGRPAVGALAIDHLGDAPRFQSIRVQELGADLHETYVRANTNDAA